MIWSFWKQSEAERCCYIKYPVLKRDFETSFIVSSGPNLLSESMNYILVLPCGLSGKSSRDYLENDLLSRTSREHACDLLAKIAIPRAFIRRKLLRNLNPKKLNTRLIYSASLLKLQHCFCLISVSLFFYPFKSLWIKTSQNLPSSVVKNAYEVENSYVLSRNLQLWKLVTFQPFDLQTPYYMYGKV